VDGWDAADTAWGRLRAWLRVLRASLVARVKASGLYGQCWQVATVISVLKRKFGGGVRRRGLRLAGCGVLAKGVVYNLPAVFCGYVCLECVVGPDWVSLQQSNC